MPIVDGRLVCCVCGSDLGFGEDEQYADPDCADCERNRLLAELEAERESVEYPGHDNDQGMGEARHEEKLCRYDEGR